MSVYIKLAKIDTVPDIKLITTNTTLELPTVKLTVKLRPRTLLFRLSLPKDVYDSSIIQYSGLYS